MKDDKPQAVASNALLAALESEQKKSKKLMDEFRANGIPNHNCNCPDYRIGVFDGLAIAMSEVRKLISANPRADRAAHLVRGTYGRAHWRVGLHGVVGSLNQENGK